MRVDGAQQQLPLFTDHPTPVVEEAAEPGCFSRFVVYVEESGDHVLSALDPNYPMFVLAFCVFYKRHYSERVVPALQKFKFNHFGHDSVVRHEHEIRKEQGPFRFQSRAHRLQFTNELTGIIEQSNFILIACAIDKRQLQARQDAPENAYHVALGFCMETLQELMLEKRQDGAVTHVAFECRGKKEDNALELEFRRICDGANRWGKALPFSIVLADKKMNSAGLRVAVGGPSGAAGGLERAAAEPAQSRIRGAQAHVLLQWRPKFGGPGFRELGAQGLSGPTKRKAPMRLTEAAAPTGNPQST